MSAQSCSRLLEELETLVRNERNFMVTFSVLHLLFSPMAALGNVLVLHALSKSSSIPANAKKMFSSLACSDIAVGMLSQPLMGVIIAVALQMASTDDQDRTDLLCPAILPAFYFPVVLLGCASFLNMIAIAADTLLAISLHLRYQELVTSKRVIIALVSLWLTSAVSALVYISLPEGNDMVTGLSFVGLVLTTATYVYICKVVRHHQNQIVGQRQIQNSQAVEVLRQKKIAYNVIFLFLVFLACYLPYCSSEIVLITNKSLPSLKAKAASIFLVLLNSSLNPLIYCWRYRELRKIVKSTLKKVMCINEEET